MSISLSVASNQYEMPFMLGLVTAEDIAVTDALVAIFTI